MNSLIKTKRTWNPTGKLVVMVLASLACILWGSAISVVKMGYQILGISASSYGSQILFGGVRFTLAGLVIVAIFSSLQGRLVRPRRETLGLTVKLSFFQTTGQYLFYYVGIANTTGANAAIIQGSNVFVALVISSMIFKMEKLTLSKALGCLVGFAGIILVNAVRFTGPVGLDFFGDGFIFLSVILYSLSAVLIKNYAAKENTIVLSSYQFIWGGLVMSMVGLVMGGTLPALSVSGVVILIYLALVSAVAYTIWGTLLKYNDVSNVAIYGFVTPVMGVLLAAVLLNEHQSLNPFTLGSLVLVSIGIYIVNRKRV